MNLSKLLKGISGEIASLAEKIEYRKCAHETLVYRDCFETIRVLTKYIKPNRLCDIGAHTGDWTYVMSRLNDELQHVVMFEPQKKYIQKLNELSLPGVQKVVYGCGLGSKEDVMVIKGGTASASLLEAAPSQHYYFPGSINDEKEEVQIRTLDTIYADDELPYPDVIKLDVQGFELNVLEGARNILSQAKYLVIELSFYKLYTGQPALWQILHFLDDQKYELIDRGYEWRSVQSDSRILQIDGIFKNTLH